MKMEPSDWISFLSKTRSKDTPTTTRRAAIANVPVSVAQHKSNREKDLIFVWKIDALLTRIGPHRFAYYTVRVSINTYTFARHHKTQRRAWELIRYAPSCRNNCFKKEKKPPFSPKLDSCEIAAFQVPALAYKAGRPLLPRRQEDSVGLFIGSSQVGTECHTEAAVGFFEKKQPSLQSIWWDSLLVRI